MKRQKLTKRVIVEVFAFFYVSQKNPSKRALFKNAKMRFLEHAQLDKN